MRSLMAESVYITSKSNREKIMNSYYTLLRLSQCRAILAFTLSMFVSTVALADNAVVVIPMAGDDLKPLTNIITVAKQNGDYSNPLVALAAITNASATNPYLIVIAPGTYKVDPQLVMKPFVDIAGSGRDVTILSSSAGGSALNSSSALIVGANNSSLQDLSIFGTDRASNHVSGIFNLDASPTISNIGITLAGGAARYGVTNLMASAPTISGIEIETYTSTLQIGVYNTGSSAIINDATMFQSGSDGLLVGIFNAVGGTSIVDSFNFETSGGSTNKYGVFNTGAGAFAKIRNSTMSAGISAGSGSGSDETYISNTILDGPVTGDPICSFSFLVDGTELDIACLGI